MYGAPRRGNNFPIRGRGRGNGRGGRGRGGDGNDGSFGLTENRRENYAEANHNGEPNEYDEYHSGPAWPPRPLTRVMARARGTNDSKVPPPPSADEEGGGGGGTKAMANYDNAYRIEVNEFITRNAPQGSAIPCVTVRDMRTFISNRRQRRAYIPVAVADELCRILKKCRQDDGKGPFDVSKLPLRTLQCPVTKKKVEIERVTDAEGISTRLRTFMEVPEKAQCKEDDLVEVIELRNELMGHLVKFLEDVATRYRPLKDELIIPSLYSYSGERRFYYDLRETRWGIRLHVSQVTEMHRNVIGIPLESVVAFRDRLNQAISFLDLEKKAPRGRGGPSGNQKKLPAGENGPGDDALPGDGRLRTTSGDGRNRRGRGGRGRGRGRGQARGRENEPVIHNEVPNHPSETAPNVEAVGHVENPSGDGNK